MQAGELGGGAARGAEQEHRPAARAGLAAHRGRVRGHDDRIGGAEQAEVGVVARVGPGDQRCSSRGTSIARASAAAQALAGAPAGADQQAAAAACAASALASWARRKASLGRNRTARLLPPTRQAIRGRGRSPSRGASSRAAAARRSGVTRCGTPTVRITSGRVRPRSSCAGTASRSSPRAEPGPHQLDQERVRRAALQPARHRRGAAAGGDHQLGPGRRQRGAGRCRSARAARRRAAGWAAGRGVRSGSA